MRAKSIVVLALWAAVLTVAIIFAWRYFFPNPREVIHGRITELARLVSFSPKEGQLAKLANAQKAASFFTENAVIQVEVSGYTTLRIEGHDDILRALMTARTQLSSVNVQFLDVKIALSPDRQSATAHLTVKGQIAGDRDLEVMELKMELKKTGRDWLIQKVESVKTLTDRMSATRLAA